MTKKLITVILILAMTAGLISGCANTGALAKQKETDSTLVNSAQVSDSKKAASDGDKSVTLPLVTNVSTIDASAASIDVDMTVIGCIEEGLYKASEKGFALALASADNVTDDGLKHVFTIRDDAKWSNGDAVTAHDFEYSWKRLANPDTGAEYAYMLTIAGIKNAEKVISGKLPVDDLGIKAIDDKTLEVDCDHYVPYFDEILSMTFLTPLNEKFVEEQGNQYGLSAKTTLYSGYFKVTDWQPGNETVVLEKNDSYYDLSVSNLDKLTFQTITETQTGIMAYENGDIDRISLVGDLISQYKNSDEITYYPGGQLYYIEPNLNNKYLQNENIRQAIARAIDRKTITNDILQNGSQPAQYIVVNDIGHDDNGKTFREYANSTYLDYDINTALQYWNKGLKELGVKEISLELLYDDTLGQSDIAEFLQGKLQEELPGLTVTLQQQPKKNRIQLMCQGSFDLGLTKWGADFDDPDTFMELFVTGNAYNHSEFSNEKYDALVKKGNSEDVNDTAKRYTDFIEAEKILLDGAYTFPIYQDASAVLQKKDVEIPNTPRNMPIYTHIKKK